MHCEFKMFAEMNKINKKRDVQFMVILNYKMYPEVIYNTNQKLY